jgi:hypothetical protein
VISSAGPTAASLRVFIETEPRSEQLKDEVMSSAPPLDPSLVSLLSAVKEIPPLLDLVRARVIKRALSTAQPPGGSRVAGSPRRAKR